MFSFRTTPLDEQGDRVLSSGKLGVFCNQTAWNPQTGLYLFESVARWGNVVRVFYTGEIPASPSMKDAEFVQLDAGDTESVVPEIFDDVDALIVEYQDTGSRFDPMTSLLFYIFQMFHHTGKKISVYVLDRQNPDGRIVEGTCICEELPHRHGLTIGETANLLYSEVGARFPLHIISYMVRPAAQLLMPWSIPSFSDYAGLFTSAFYSGMTVVENAGFSVGRGTVRPFEFFGSPELKPLVTGSRDWNAPDSPLADTAVILRPSLFTPLRGVYVGCECYGFQLIPRPGEQYHSLAHSLKILHFIRDEFGVPDLAGAEMAVGDADLFGFITGEVSWDDAKEHLKVEEQKWVRKARRYMLYDEQLSRIRTIR